MTTFQNLEDPVKYYRIYVKYALMIISAFLMICIFDYLFKKPTGERSSPAPPAEDNKPLSKGVDNGLFDDNTVIEETERNYYYDKYLNLIESGENKHIPFSLPRHNEPEMLERAKNFWSQVNGRRSCRFFSSDPVPREVIEQCILAAGTSPSGAHTEPWQFVVVTNKEDKLAIREIVEDEEQVNYERRMGKTWLKDLAKIRTTYVKEYISDAHCVILVFKEPFHLKNEEKYNNWYYEASVSISVGILLCALNNVGLVTVTSTPMNCGPALRRLFNRPHHEKLAFLLPVGYPAENATVPQLQRKPLQDICTFIE